MLKTFQLRGVARSFVGVPSPTGRGKVRAVCALGHKWTLRGRRSVSELDADDGARRRR